jgi:hypothetical protein
VVSVCKVGMRISEDFVSYESQSAETP